MFSILRGKLCGKYCAICLKINYYRRLKKMETKQEEYACNLCSYTGDGKFKGDICSGEINDTVR